MTSQGQGATLAERVLKLRQKLDTRFWRILNDPGGNDPYISRQEAQQWLKDIDEALATPPAPSPSGAMAEHAQDAARLLRALSESVKLQSHYATLLNQYDGGKRMVFSSTAQWLAG